MRAVCEACDALQPPDWKAGDLCSACGHAVRQEARCFWCVEWTPAGKFCRGCGAEVVEPRRFGAARMLKDAGTDRFTVPKMLRELDPEQLDNFSRIYERHAAVAERHVSDLRLLERHLRSSGASAALEDALVRELPWPADRLKALRLKPLPAGDDLATVAAIAAATPFEQTRALAAVVRLRLGDLAALREVAGLVGMDAPVGLEAARVLTWWRTAVRAERAGRELFGAERSWLAVVAASPDPLEAALFAPGRPDPEALRPVLDAPDPELRIAAALALGERDRLGAMLAADPEQRWAAACRFADLGAAAALAPVLAAADAPLRLAILRRWRGKEPVPELRQALLDILAELPPPEGRPRQAEVLADRALRLVARGLPDELAGRVARCANQGLYGCQGVLCDEAGLGPAGVAAVIDELIARGTLGGDMTGIEAAARRGAIPEDFVPRRFDPALPPELRIELLRVAEHQYAHGAGDGVLRLFWRTLYIAPELAVREAAWWGQLRAERARGMALSEKGALVLDVAAIERCFGPVREFLPRFEAMLGDPTFREGQLRDHLCEILRYSPEAAIGPVLAVDPAAGGRIIDRAAELMPLGPPFDSTVVEFLRMLAADPLWRPRIAPYWQAWKTGGAVPMHVWDRLSERCGGAV